LGRIPGLDAYGMQEQRTPGKRMIVGAGGAPETYATGQAPDRLQCVSARSDNAKPIVLITGAAGNIGRGLAAMLADDYRVVGLDRPGSMADFPLIEADLSNDQSVRKALADFRNRFGEL
jgi:pimeloyl-ACP methyl ester carboxylesterase